MHSFTPSLFLVFFLCLSHFICLSSKTHEKFGPFSKKKAQNTFLSLIFSKKNSEKTTFLLKTSHKIKK